MTSYEEQYNKLDWMDEEQWECAKFIADLHGGFHHLFGKMHPLRSGVSINSTSSRNRFHTFDYDYLTRAVIAAHDRCIRFGIEPGGPGMLQLWATKRKREGGITERHPTLEEAISKIRGENVKG